MIQIKSVFVFALLLLCGWFLFAEEPIQKIQYDFINLLPDFPSLYTSTNATFKDPNWEIDFSKASSVSFNHPSLSLFGTPSKFILKLWTSSAGSELEILFGSHFQFFRKKIGNLQYGAQTIEFNAPPEGWEFYGGENDGKVQIPLRFLQLQVNKANCPSQILQLRILNFTCETAIAPYQECILVSKTFQDDKKQLYSLCSLMNLLPNEVQGDLSIQVKDWEQNIMTQFSQKITLPPSAQSINMKIPVQICEDKNFAEVCWTFKRSDGREFLANSTYSKDIDFQPEKTPNPDSPWGMGLFLYRYGSDQKRMEKAAELASKAGIKWTREEFGWGHLEPEPGKFNFDYYDNVVNTALSYGISVYGLLCYWSSWTQPYTSKGIEDFVRYTEATVNHFKDRIKFWEIYNEPNIFFWQGPKELYPELVKRCYETIKKIDPSAQVLAISTAGIDFNFIDFCLKANTPFDILTIHPYRRNLDDIKFMDELKRVANQVQNRPVWITEMGWSSHLWKGGVTEREQACLFARCYLSAIASGAVQNTSWYDFKNDGDDPFYFEQNFGIIRNDFSQKPALRACAHICRLLPGKSIQTRNEFGENIIAFQQGNIVVVWSAKEDKDLTIKVTDIPVKVQNLMGEVLTEIDKKTTTTLHLKKGYPIFLIGGKVKGIKQK